MKHAIFLVAVLALPGCAGLDVEWQLHATYLTDDLKAKRQADEDKARAQRHVDDMMRQVRPK